MYYTDLSMSAHTAYMEIMDQTRSRDIDSLATLSGSFQTRTVKGRPYVYFGYRDVGGAPRMVYVGPDDERVRALVSKFKIEKSYPTLSPLSQSAQILGCHGMQKKHFKITKQLADYGFFKAGGILVGTHAFLAIGNMLGVKWASGDKTLDVDFAHAGKNISIALPADIKISVRDALTSLEMGLLPIGLLSGVSGAQYRNPSDPELRVDFLTAEGKEKDNVVMNELGLALEPLKFMEFSLEGTTQAAILGRDGACVVNIPAAERFAIHKLIVYGERSQSDKAKSIKDVEQAAALVSWHLQNSGEHKIVEAWTDAMSRGPGWRRRATEGLNAMLARHPDLDLPGLWGDLGKNSALDAGQDDEGEPAPAPIG